MKTNFFKYKFTFCLTLLLFAFNAHKLHAQRLSDVNTLGWYAGYGTFYLHKNVSLWAEYQWRRDDVITDWQQSLLRVGGQYHFKNDVSVAILYGYIISYPYGDFPAGPYTVPEHRITEQLVWNSAIGRLGLNHRIRLEQRFVGKVNQQAATYDVTDYTYLNRMRYQLRGTLPLNKPTMQDKTFYLAAFDELFIGFGKNVNQNIFDQNRVGLLLGYQLNKVYRVEAGYFNQTVQQGGLVRGRQVYQYNHGLMINNYFTLK